MRHLIVLATGMVLLTAADYAAAAPFAPVGFSSADGGAQIVLVQAAAPKDETLKQKAKRIWRNLAGYKFDVSCPFTSRSCAETGKDREDARSKCISRNPLCWVSDAK